MRSTEPGCFRSRSWSLWKALDEERGAWAWFHGVWTCGGEVLEYWMISSLKIRLNHSWKFRRNWNVPLVLLERSWWAGFNRIYLVRFGFRMWEILILKWFLPLKIQINSKKPGFGKEKSVENVVTLEGFPFNSYVHCKTMFTCWVSLFCNGYTLGLMAQVTLVNMKKQFNMCLFMSMFIH